MRVNVAVTTVWASPDSPRPVDEAAVADHPDPVAWLAALDARALDDELGHGRLGLHGRMHTQALAGEPVVVVAEPSARSGHGGWVEVACPWQPSARDPRGYPGWARRAHLIPDDTGAHEAPPPDESWSLGAQEAQQPILAFARQHLGLPYLWGGMSPLGLDCSGLVHLAHREVGSIVPRDAKDQQDACAPVRLDDVRPGDLYFFAHPGRAAHHVGIVTGPGRMIHAPQTGREVVEERLTAVRWATLGGAGRLRR